nr:PREDICTED: 5-hydroxyisourate hydrolase-like [Struthio camelus australis]
MSRPAQGTCIPTKTQYPCPDRRLADRHLQMGTHGPAVSGTAPSDRRVTDNDGRCLPLLAPGQAKASTYKLRFETAAYWQGLGHTSFYPYVEVVFTIVDPAQKLHVPLLISPYSYTTYRGS